MNRRSFLQLAAACAAYPLLSRTAGAAVLAAADDALLEDMSRRCFRYFWEQTDPQTGITRGRARADGSEYPKERRDVGSTGDTGFGLTALCIGAERGWVARADARERARATLRSFADGPVKSEHGWFYHWINVKTGERTGAQYDSASFGNRPGPPSKRPKSEVSVSDSTWLVAGALTARQYFREDPEIVQLATKIYERVDYRWMCHGHPTLMAKSWMPETGFSDSRYDRYDQLPCMYLLGIGAPSSFALPPESWYAWERNPNQYQNYRYVGTSLLWTYQYPFAWFDLRGRRENRGSRLDYFANSATATRAHRAFCIDLGKKFPGYSPDIWGITSSLSKTGYKAWGGPPGHHSIDGTVVPCAAAGSLMFAPDICLRALHAMKDRFGDRIYGRYGFADAFDPSSAWVAQDTIALDLGISLLAAENLRFGSVWRWFMANPEPRQALHLAGIEPDPTAQVFS